MALQFKALVFTKKARQPNPMQCWCRRAATLACQIPAYFDLYQLFIWHRTESPHVRLVGLRQGLGYSGACPIIPTSLPGLPCPIPLSLAPKHPLHASRILSPCLSTSWHNTHLPSGGRWHLWMAQAFPQVPLTLQGLGCTLQCFHDIQCWCCTSGHSS